MTLRAALFDFGGVILSSPFEAFARYESEHGLPDGFIRSVNARDHHTNAWARLERGEISVGQFATAFEQESAAMGHPVAGWDVLGLLSGEIRPTMVRAVRRCAQHLKTGLLTNNVVRMGNADVGEADAHDQGSSAVAEVVALFDVVVESSVVGVRKPEPRFYEIACEQLGIDPTEAVFLDDLGVNLKPARAMGMTTIKVDDPAVAIAELEDVVGFSLS